MEKSPRNRSLIFALVALFLLLSFFLLKNRLQKEIPEFLTESVAKNCLSCRLKVAKGEIHFFPPSLVLNGISFEAGQPHDSYFTGEINEITFNLLLLDLLSRRLNFSEIRLDHPNVTLVEGSFKSPSQQESTSSPPQLFECKRLTVSDGTFIYQHEPEGSLKKRLSRIAVYRIKGSISDLGNLPNRRDVLTHAQVTAILEHSGEINLKIEALPFSPLVHVDVTLDLVNQRLEEVNPFFEVSDGITLKGTLLQTQTHIAIRGSHLQGQARAVYKDLGIKFQKNSSRGSVTAFFSTLLASLTLKAKNLRSIETSTVEITSLKRKPAESVVSLVLRGMMNASLKIPKRQQK